MNHVLLIEPDRSLAESITLALASGSTKVNWVTGAQDAIAAADKQCPTIVVLELGLPLHNGIEFLYEFRSYNEWANIPVIMFTMQQISTPQLLTKLGVVSYLYKPTTPLARLKQVTQEYVNTLALVTK